MKYITIIFFIVLILTNNLYANDIYVRSDGAAASEGSSTGPCNTSSACASLSNANSWVDAGDTIIMCDDGGDYTTGRIEPAVSGTNNTTRVTYQAASGDTPTINTGVNGYGLYLSSKSWITIDGITFEAEIPLMMINADYCLIQNSIFDSTNDVDSTYVANSIYSDSQYNKFYNNVFKGSGTGDTLRLGDSFNSDTTSYNYFTGNEFYYAIHAVFQIASYGNVIENNYIRNNADDWGCDGQSNCGDRAFLVAGVDSQRNLVKDNRFAFAWEDGDASMAPGFELVSPYNIVRRNVFYSNEGNGLLIVNEDGYEPDSVANYNTIYNNTFFYNGTGTAGYKAWRWNVTIADWGDGDPIGNIIKFNIFWDSFAEDIEPANNTNGVRLYGIAAGQTITGNWHGWNDGSDKGDGDPSFADNTIPVDKTDNTKPDFTPQTGSGVIDNANYLTLANGSGSSSTSLIVDNADYYFDTSPWYIDNATNTAWMNIPKEYIFIVGWVSPIEIIDINYSTETLTLASAQSWSDNSETHSAYSSTVGFYGSNPDQGAIEVNTSPGPSPPNMSAPLPQGNQTCNASGCIGNGTVILDLTTDVAANCKYDTSDTDYDSMANIYSSTGSTDHVQSLSLACDAAYIYYSRCQSIGTSDKNTSSETQSFSILECVLPIENIESNESGSGGQGSFN